MVWAYLAPPGAPTDLGLGRMLMFFREQFAGNGLAFTYISAYLYTEGVLFFLPCVWIRHAGGCNVHSHHVDCAVSQWSLVQDQEHIFLYLFTLFCE